jgi:hypothetical protein
LSLYLSEGREPAVELALPSLPGVTRLAEYVGWGQIAARLECSIPTARKWHGIGRESFSPEH